MFKKLLSLVLVVVFSCLISCTNTKKTNEDVPRFRPKIFTTNYSEKEHVLRIKEITNKIISIHNYYEPEIVFDFDVYILYSFDERPEYFYILFQLGEFTDGVFETTRYLHFLGFIENDEYFGFYMNRHNNWQKNKGFWGEYNVLNEKKYLAYPYYCGYKKDNQLVTYSMEFDKKEFAYFYKETEISIEFLIEKNKKEYRPLGWKYLCDCGKD